MMKKLTAYGVFALFTEQKGRYPTLEEFKQMGYSRATYFRCKKDYKPTEPEEFGAAYRINTEQFDNGVTIIELRF